ncbi:unnamed protein product [Orchesella dallaii]|uniref:Acetyl-CoA carboxylase n=1 Tax=Orchesella dallaii TaxID=48710 RepID=A0ABP1RUD5_9HEXA
MEQTLENLVVALKELSIRCDFRTTVEYLIKLLETPSFQDNTIYISSLDAMIAKRCEADKPDIMIGVLCGPLHVADQAVVKIPLRKDHAEALGDNQKPPPEPEASQSQSERTPQQQQEKSLSLHIYCAV